MPRSPDGKRHPSPRGFCRNAAGEGFDPFSLFESQAQLPVAARITGDPDRIEAVLAKIRAALPAADAKLLLSRRVGEDVVVSANADYLAEFATSGSLGETGRFLEVVPNADKATSVFFVNFDVGDWFVKMMGSDEERANAGPLESLGFTVWADGDRERLARLTVED